MRRGVSSCHIWMRNANQDRVPTSVRADAQNATPGASTRWADLGQSKTSYSDHHGYMAPDYTGAVQQLMFNRILSAVRLLSVDGVTITRFDAETGTLEGNL